MRLSVVIPSYNDPSLQRAIDSALALNPFEIIIADSSAVSPKVSENPKITIIHNETQMFPGEARNRGAEKATGDVILFLDSDVQLTEGGKKFIAEWLDSSVPGPDIALGLYAMDTINLPTFWHVNLIRHRVRDLNKNEKIKQGFSSHMLIKRETLEKIAGFHPGLRIREDTEFFIRAQILGYSCQIFPEFEGFHLKKFTLPSLMKDYCLRTLRTVFYQQLYPHSFAPASVLFPTRYKIGLALSPLLALFSLAGFVQPFLFFALPAALVAPFLLSPEAFFALTLAQKALCSVIYSLVGASIATGVFLGTLRALAFKLRQKARGLLDWARIAKRVLIRSGHPIQLVQFLTSRCNLRCQHCFYKATLDDPNAGELSLTQLQKTFRELGPLLWYAAGGGEPFLRKDLADIYGALVENCRPKMFTLPTNGWYTDKTLVSLTKMLRLSQGLPLFLNFSIDGPEKIHDEIRSPGSWSKLKETYARVEPLQRIYPNLKISILTTVTEQNFQAFPKFIDELAETFAPDQINVLLHRNKDRHSPLPAPVLSAYNAAIDRYLQLLNGKRIGTLNMASGLFLRIKEFVQKDIIYRVAQKDEFVTPCQAGKLSYVIWEDGRMAPCEMRDDRIGNILEESVQSLVRNQYSQALRKDIKDSKCKCTYECAMSINSFFSFPGNLALLKGIFTFLQSGRLSRPHSDKFAGPR